MRQEKGVRTESQRIDQEAWGSLIGLEALDLQDDALLVEFGRCVLERLLLRLPTALVLSLPVQLDRAAGISEGHSQTHRLRTAASSKGTGLQVYMSTGL